MATLQQIEAAIKIADQQGNVDDAKELAKQYKSRSEQINVLEGAAKAVAQGVSFGFSDEVIGAVKGSYDALTTDQSFGDAYDENVDEQRQRLDMFREQNPVIAYGSEIAGAIASGGGLVGLAARAAPKLIAQAPKSMLGKMGQSSAVAGAEGAIYGVGTGEDSLENRAKEAAKSGLLSAATGPLAPVVGSLAKKGTRGIRRYLASRKENLSPEAYEMLQRALLADGALEDEAKRALASGGKNAMLADATPTATALVDVAIQRGGAQGRQARRALENRVRQEGKELKKTFDESLTRTNDLVPFSGTKPTIKELYDKAYAQPIDYSEGIGKEIEDLVANRVPNGALTEAKNLMRIEGEKSQQILFQLADDGERVIGFKKMPDVRELDYITRGLNEFADTQNGKGKLGGTTQAGRATANLSRDIRSRMKELVPDYAEALKVSGGKIRDRQAYEFGGNVFTPKVERQLLQDKLETMGEAEAREVARGIRDVVDERLANVKTVLSDPNTDAREAYTLVKDLSSRASKQKLRDVMVAAHGAKTGGTKYRAIMKKLSNASRALTTRAGTAVNSKTYVRQMTDDMANEIAGSSAVDELLKGRPISAAQSMVSQATGRSPEDVAKQSDAVFEELAEYLTKVRGLSAVQATERIKRLAPVLNEGADKLQREVDLSAITPLAVTPNILSDQP